MKTFLVVLILAMVAPHANAGDIDYAVNKIPPELLVNAYAVKRYEDIRFEVVNLDKAKYYHKVAYTILNEKGDKFAHCLEDYDKLQSVESIEGRLYDENGRKIKSLKQSDIQDRTGSGEGNLADDNRIKFHSFYHKVYPYTVEYEVELRFNYTMFYPGWVPLDDENMSLENGKMTVVLPEGIDFRYKTFNFKNDPVITTQKSSRMYTWELKNLAAVEEEFASPHWYEITPVVCMAPVQFQVQGYTGNMSTWQDFGKFVYALKSGRDQLPDNIKQTVHTLTDNEPDIHKKIGILYGFLQKNSRYISIQLGIGGWQPFDAKYVAANQYGDCKALTNYMYSLLKEAGIKSYYTLVKAGVGSKFLISDFPSSQFNHVILSVPLLKDTVWLECTSQTLPTGYLSGFTSDRNVLLIDENGGTLVKTPLYNMTDNLQVRKIKAEINAEGNLSTDVSTVYRARQEDNVHSLINSLAKDKVLEYLKEEIDLPNYDVVNFDYKEELSSVPSISETLKITAPDYAQISGKRLFVCPNILSRSRSKFSLDSARKYDIDLSYAYTDIDSIEISIPVGYTPESVPKDVQVDSKFGSYFGTLKVSGDKIIYYRSMKQFSGRFPAKEYEGMVSFYNQIYKADRAKVVFVKIKANG
ncbi:MAG: DUF3857 domain-containing protein [Chitinophagaceae bacterium]